MDERDLALASMLLEATKVDVKNAMGHIGCGDGKGIALLERKDGKWKAYVCYLDEDTIEPYVHKVYDLDSEGMENNMEETLTDWLQETFEE